MPVQGLADRAHLGRLVGHDHGQLVLGQREFPAGQGVPEVEPLEIVLERVEPVLDDRQGDVGVTVVNDRVVRASLDGGGAEPALPAVRVRVGRDVPAQGREEVGQDADRRLNSARHPLGRDRLLALDEFLGVLDGQAGQAGGQGVLGHVEQGVQGADGLLPPGGDRLFEGRPGDRVELDGHVVGVQQGLAVGRPRGRVGRVGPGLPVLRVEQPAADLLDRDDREHGLTEVRGPGGAAFLPGRAPSGANPASGNSPPETPPPGVAPGIDTPPAAGAVPPTFTRTAMYPGFWEICCWAAAVPPAAAVRATAQYQRVTGLRVMASTPLKERNTGSGGAGRGRPRVRPRAGRHRVCTWASR